MVLNSEEYRLAFTGVVLAASCLTSFYFARQNRLLRRLIDSNNDHSLVLTKDDDESDSLCSENKTMDERKFVMEEIGVIQSPFPQRAGCPRQGTLAPHVKSLLVLHTHVSPQVLDGIQAYSHLWIIFQFHLNPRNKAKKQQQYFFQAQVYGYQSTTTACTWTESWRLGNSSTSSTESCWIVFGFVRKCDCNSWW